MFGRINPWFVVSREFSQEPSNNQIDTAAPIGRVFVHVDLQTTVHEQNKRRVDWLDLPSVSILVHSRKVVVQLNPAKMVARVIPNDHAGTDFSRPSTISSTPRTVLV